jgi:hypothetical protein
MNRGPGAEWSSTEDARQGRDHDCGHDAPRDAADQPSDPLDAQVFFQVERVLGVFHAPGYIVATPDVEIADHWPIKWAGYHETR